MKLSDEFNLIGALISAIGINLAAFGGLSIIGFFGYESITKNKVEPQLVNTVANICVVSVGIISAGATIRYIGDALEQ